MLIFRDLLFRRYLFDPSEREELEEELRTIAGDFIDTLDDFVTSILNPAAHISGKESSTAEYGDIIGVDRVLYKHYGVYLGDRTVIHYAPLDNEFMEKSIINETTLENFLNGADSYFICKFPATYGKPEEINIPSATSGSLFALQWTNFYEYIKRKRYHLYSPDETVERATGRLGEESYNLLSNNCEHFAIWCKTGISESHQVNEILRFIPLLPVMA